jgi:hypothetical protein
MPPQSESDILGDQEQQRLLDDPSEESEFARRREAANQAVPVHAMPDERETSLLHYVVPFYGFFSELNSKFTPQFVALLAMTNLNQGLCQMAYLGT